MAVGDLVSQVGTSSFTFQPASGVQVCITQFITTTGGAGSKIQGRGNINSLDLFFGVTGGNASGQYPMGEWNSTIFKFFIDNSSYIYFYASSATTGFSGIQTA